MAPASRFAPSLNSNAPSSGECQREGIALAKRRNAYNGRKKTLTPERAAELVKRAAVVPGSVLASDYGISRETVYPRLATLPWKLFVAVSDRPSIIGHSA